MKKKNYKRYIKKQVKKILQDFFSEYEKIIENEKNIFSLKNGEMKSFEPAKHKI